MNTQPLASDSAPVPECRLVSLLSLPKLLVVLLCSCAFGIHAVLPTLCIVTAMPFCWHSWHTIGHCCSACTTAYTCIWCTTCFSPACLPYWHAWCYYSMLLCLDIVSRSFVHFGNMLYFHTLPSCVCYLCTLLQCCTMPIDVFVLYMLYLCSLHHCLDVCTAYMVLPVTTCTYVVLPITACILYFGFAYHCLMCLFFIWPRCVSIACILFSVHCLCVSISYICYFLFLYSVHLWLCDIFPHSIQMYLLLQSSLVHHCLHVDVFIVLYHCLDVRIGYMFSFLCLMLRMLLH